MVHVRYSISFLEMSSYPDESTKIRPNARKQTSILKIKVIKRWFFLQVAFLIQYYDIKRFIFSTKKINLEKSNFGNLCPWEKGLVYTAISIVLAAVVIECGLSIDSLPPPPSSWPNSY